MLPPLNNKVALITGSTSGIGLAIAKRLAGAGARVIINGTRDKTQVEGLKKEIAMLSLEPVDYCPADLRLPDQVMALVRHVEDHYGQLDILVNNAGIQHVDRVEAFPRERWDSILALHLSAVFHACAAALPGMQRRNEGRIVNIASVHGLVASTEKAAYVAAKHGVIGLTKVIALENATQNITCNAICPGWVRTPLVEAQIQARAVAEGIEIEDAARWILQLKEPSQRFTLAEDVAEMVVFLCSPSALNMTGASITMDGGWMAQ